MGFREVSFLLARLPRVEGVQRPSEMAAFAISTGGWKQESHSCPSLLQSLWDFPTYPFMEHMFNKMSDLFNKVVFIQWVFSAKETWMT